MIELPPIEVEIRAEVGSEVTLELVEKRIVELQALTSSVETERELAFLFEVKSKM